MIGTTPEFKNWVQTDYAWAGQVVAIQNGAVVYDLTDYVYTADITADATAAQLRTVTLSVGDPNGDLRPAAITDMLAPYDTRIQIFEGVHKSHVTIITSTSNDVTTWGPGTHMGTKADPTTGALTLA